jgi:hypothetical protein
MQRWYSIIIPAVCSWRLRLRLLLIAINITAASTQHLQVWALQQESVALSVGMAHIMLHEHGANRNV